MIRFIVDLHVSVRNVSELYSLIKHVHSRVKSCIGVVCWIIFSHTLLWTDEGWELTSRAHTKYRRVDVVVD